MSIDRFSILVARKLSGEASLEEIRELEALLRTHPDLHFSIEILTNLWNQQAQPDEEKLESAYDRHISRMNNMGMLLLPSSKEDTDIPFLLHGSRNNRFVRNIVITTSILVIIAAVFFLYFTEKTSTKQVEGDTGLAAVTTKFGSRSNMQLPDGSKVWLNSGSTITYDKKFGNEIREVTLSGEAFFDVVRNPEKPFIIHTQSMDVKVLGTQFNVKSYANDKLSEASLINGSIEIILKRKGSEKILLKPNYKLVVVNESLVKDTTPVFMKKYQPEPEIGVQKLNYSSKDSTIVETSWVENKLTFQDESFEDIAVRMERWYGKKIQFDDPSFKTMRFTGTFVNETMEQAMEALHMTANFNYITRNNTIIITK